MQAEKKKQLAAADWIGNKWGLLFTDHQGRPLDRRKVSAQFAAAAKKSLGFAFAFHGLRHTRATLLLSAGEYINAVSKRLGHANIETTLSICGHVLPQQPMDIAVAFKRIVG